MTLNKACRGVDLKVRIAYYDSMHTEKAMTMNNTKKIEIAVYGGAFNPPHIGHADAIRQACAKASKVLVIPSYVHPMGKEMAPFASRMEWVSRFIREMQEEGLDVEISDIEQDIYIETAEPVFSYRLLEAVARKTGVDKASIALVVGEDNRNNLDSFKEYERILASFQILIVNEEHHIHSSQIRQQLESLKSVSQWLPAGLALTDLAFFLVTPSPHKDTRHAL